MADILEWKDSHPLRYVEEISHSVVGDVLNLASKILAKRGWSRSTLGAFGGPLCVRGAIIEAVGGFEAMTEDSWAALAASKTERALRNLPEVAVYGSVPYWNDSADLTGERVYAVMRDLAATLKARGGE